MLVHNVQKEVERPAIKLETVSSAQTVETPTEKPQPVEEKPEIEPRPKYSDGVQLSLLDLWGMTEEVSQQPKTAKKKAGLGNQSSHQRLLRDDDGTHAGAQEGTSGAGKAA